MRGRLELLHEPAGLPAFPLPDALREAYGGSLGFPGERVYANFVSTLDGVVAIPGVSGSVRLIRGASEADPLVMGLLRACADALLMGAGTFRASKEARWVAESIHPPAAEAFAELRRRLGRDEPPELAVVTASGRLDPSHPAFGGPVLVLTSDGGAAALGGRLPASAEVVSLGPGPEVDLRLALETLRGRGRRLILTEGGPTLFGELCAAGLVDELFLTLSPVLAGRASGARVPLVKGVELLPERTSGGNLLGVRREGAHLFLRLDLR